MFPSSYVAAILLDRNAYQPHYNIFDESCKMRHLYAANYGMKLVIAAVGVSSLH